MSLRVDLTGNGTGFSQMLDKARAQARSFSNDVSREVGSSWAGVGKMAAGWFAGLAGFEGVRRGFEWFIHTGKEIKEQSEQVDMSTDSWQKWMKAVDDAGLSTEGFIRVLESLRQKRTEAMTDPKARGQLSRLGFSDSEITGDMDTDTFIKRALANAKGGDEQRKYLADIIGNRGLKYATAVPFQEKADAPFSPTDLRSADELSRAGRDLGDKIAPIGVLGARMFVDRDMQKAFGLQAWRLAQAALGRGWLWNKGAGISDGVANLRDHLPTNYSPVIALRDGKPVVGTTTAAGGTGGTDANSGKVKDPMDALLAKQREDMAIADQQRQQRLLDSERGLMTIGERKASIRGELAELQKQIATRNAKMKGEGFLSEADKQSLEGVTGKAREFQVNQLRQKYQEITDDLQVRFNRGQGDLKEKPLKFDADTMSKVGLYSASAVAYNPLLGLQQKANQLLGQIARNTSPKFGGHKDPQAP